MSERSGKNSHRIVIVRRTEESAGSHHGGAWKIAYADFVTAMMAFFLVMWLINATTEERRLGIANFFNPMQNSLSPPGVLRDLPSPDGINQAGHGGTQQTDDKTVDSSIAIIHSTNDISGPAADDGGADGALQAGSGSDPAVSGYYSPEKQGVAGLSPGLEVGVPPGIPKIIPIGAPGQGAKQDITPSEEDLLMRQMQVIQNALASEVSNGSRDNTHVSVTKAGLEVELSASEARPMFQSGSATLTPEATRLLKAIVPYLLPIPGSLSIEGYTDSSTWKAGRSSNWTLSAARADMARKILTDAGFPEQRILSVSGHADRKLAVPNDPAAPANRRIILILHRDDDPSVAPADGSPSSSTDQSSSIPLGKASP
ncbi:MAG: OmpA family protein [Acetobacter sp.]|jgi:chemotaxis protein MotB|nr:OmpA family protein [Acetobacter sp.]MCH4060221.1 OmpA family protein [Acetobacter sp.]MCH4087161.1 OmpA family protein [Acetobacter sp.]MCI1292981.1 OmpA family protein [Acetobacter sp.]MCI1319567.1 OmpA family protein [Acetobacter sp.]